MWLSYNNISIDGSVFNRVAKGNRWAPNFHRIANTWLLFDLRANLRLLTHFLLLVKVHQYSRFHALRLILQAHSPKVRHAELAS
jgi:hypothetical protein